MLASMDDSAEALRHKIEVYLGYLREGVDAALAELYLQEIARARAALALLEDEREGCC